VPETDHLSDTVRLHSFISGYVQGVGFRAYVQSIATGMNLTGWVRNTGNGDVEVVAEGPQSELVHLLRLLYRGPRTAKVTHVEEIWEAATHEFHFFSIHPAGYD
jgi:acylphosphatase